MSCGHMWTYVDLCVSIQRELSGMGKYVTLEGLLCMRFRMYVSLRQQGRQQFCPCRHSSISMRQKR